MPSSDYTSTPSTGKLKLKGGPAKFAGVRKRREKQKAAKETGESETESPSQSKSENHNELEDETKAGAAAKALRDEDLDIGARDENDAEDGKEIRRERGKTEAEKRWEEQRRRRLDDRLKREGIKSHKERVEELNRYLSGLSEHHDMPRIGPG